MDEYTLIVLAKLKADRLHLQRQQRPERACEKQPIAEQRPIPVLRRSQWREQS